MAELITSWEGWEYFDNGTVIDPAGAYYFEGEKVWSPDFSGSGGASSWLSGLVNYAGKTYVDTWAKTSLMQQAQDGRLYIEGRPTMQQGTQQLSPAVVLIGAGLMFLALVK